MYTCCAGYRGRADKRKIKIFRLFSEFLPYLKGNVNFKRYNQLQEEYLHNHHTMQSQPSSSLAQSQASSSNSQRSFQQFEMTKQAGLAQIRGEGYYIEDNFLISHIEGFFSKQKSLLPLNLLIPMNKKLMSERAINSELIFDCFASHESWQKFLPERAESNRSYICNLFNTCSGMALELLVEDALTARRELFITIKALLEKEQAAQEDSGLVSIDNVQMTLEEQHRAVRSNAQWRKHAKKRNQFKGNSKQDSLSPSSQSLSQCSTTANSVNSSKRKGTIKINQAGKDGLAPSLSYSSLSELQLLQWRADRDSQDELNSLIRQVFIPEVSNILLCNMVGVCSSNLSGQPGKQKVRITIEFRQSTTMEPSSDSRMLHFLSQCHDQEFIKRQLSSVKAKVARMRLDYIITVTNPGSIRAKLPLQEPYIMAEDLEDVLKVTTCLKVDLYEQVQKLQAADPDYQSLKKRNLASSRVSSSNNSNIVNQVPSSAADIKPYKKAEFESLREVAGSIVCPLCFISLAGKHYFYFSGCGDVICYHCYQKSPKMFCPQCNCTKIVSHNGQAIDDHDYKLQLSRQREELSKGGNQQLQRYRVTNKEIVHTLKPYRAIYKDYVEDLIAQKDPQEGALKDVYAKHLEEQLAKAQEQYAQLDRDAQQYVAQVEASFQEELQKQVQLALAGAQNQQLGQTKVEEIVSQEQTWSHCLLQNGQEPVNCGQESQPILSSTNNGNCQAKNQPASTTGCNETSIGSSNGRGLTRAFKKQVALGSSSCNSFLDEDHDGELQIVEDCVKDVSTQQQYSQQQPDNVEMEEGQQFII